jgi:magnesium-transporting ATPase (P-type)
LRIFIEVVREPMLALLLGGGAIYMVIGDLKDALILLAFATLSVAITVIQETRTERVLDALRDLTSPRALVIRDGQRKRIAGRDVVRGDLVVLAEGAVKETHEAAGTVMWVYLVLHPAMAILHQLAGHDTLGRMFGRGR